jgi:hypothetical protein
MSVDHRDAFIRAYENPRGAWQVSKFEIPRI